MGPLLKTILLVEDDAIIGTAETLILEREGYNVVHVLNGKEAIDLCISGRQKIDIILMDISLGKGIDGINAAKEILKENDIPIVFLSSHTEEEVVKKTEDITFYGYVNKNVDASILIKTINMALKLYGTTCIFHMNNMSPAFICSKRIN